MKRIYLLLLLFVAFSASQGYAQRTVDLSVIGKMGSTKTNKTAIAPGTVIIADTGKNGSQFYYGWDVKNNSTAAKDSLMPGDTLFIKTAYSGSKVRYVFTAGKSLKAGNTISIFPIDGSGNEILIHLSPASASVPSSNVPNYQWCDSVWVVNGPNSAITDDQNNKPNRSCVTVNRIIVAMNVNDVASGASEFSLFPNPASGTVNLKYDFGFNANANVMIRDITGKVVYKQELGKNINGEQEYKLDISNLTTGLYIVELHANDKKIVSKISIQ